MPRPLSGVQIYAATEDLPNGKKRRFFLTHHFYSVMISFIWQTGSISKFTKHVLSVFKSSVDSHFENGVTRETRDVIAKEWSRWSEFSKRIHYGLSRSNVSSLFHRFFCENLLSNYILYHWNISLHCKVLHHVTHCALCDFV